MTTGSLAPPDDHVAASTAGRPPGRLQSGIGLPLAGRVGLPRTGHLAGRDVQPVPQVLAGDGEHQAGERRLVEMAGGLGPDLVGDRVGLIGEPLSRITPRLFPFCNCSFGLAA